MGISESDEIFECVKLKLSNSIPLAVEYKAIPLAYIPNVGEYDHSIYSIYDVFSQNNITVAKEQQKLEIVALYNPVSGLLGKSEGEPSFMLSSVLYDDKGRTVETTRLYSNSDRFVFLAKSSTDQCEDNK